jgi:hypothetical protein
MHRVFASQQEAVRKDVERAFGVLVSRWHILKNPVRLHRRTDIANVVLACVVLHDMVVEIRRDSYASELYSLTESLECRTVVDGVQFSWQSDLSHGDDGTVEGSWAHAVAQRQASVEDNATHHLFNSDLVEHICESASARHPT